MPGLVGIVSTGGKKADLDLMQAMCNTIQHQDWYKVGDYVNRLCRQVAGMVISSSSRDQFQVVVL